MGRERRSRAEDRRHRFECWADKTATFMLVGEICTRHCGFCSVGKGKPGALEIVLDARPEVFNHNVETVPRLYRRARYGSVLERSLDVLRFVDFDVATIGQYLQPTRGQLPIEKDYTPEEFAEMRSKVLSMGFRHVESGPFVCASYHAKKHVEEGSGAAVHG